MITKKTIPQDVEVIDKIICDSCGKDCTNSFDAEYMTLKADWGFISHHDLETWEAQICEQCVEEKLSFINFNITKTNL